MSQRIMTARILAAIGVTGAALSTAGCTILFPFLEGGECDVPGPGRSCFAKSDLAKLARDASAHDARADASETTDGGTTDGGESFACPNFLAIRQPPYSQFPGYIVKQVLDTGDACCYDIESNTVCGRPFLVAGQARVASAVERDDWTTRSPPLDGPLDPALRTELSRAWLVDAQMEHASIASFATFTLELLALGAPADLVAQTQRAAGEEVRHACACFALASRYAGKPLGPGRLDMPTSPPAPTLLDACVAAVEQGCIAETVAAIVAQERLRRATDAAVRRALREIARDEARHVELAWQFVRWALAAADEISRAKLKVAVAAAFQRGIEAVLGAPADSPESTLDSRALAAHGQLRQVEERQLARIAAREVLAPCAKALLEIGASSEASA